jgi:type VI secretion system secreted protein Hcp
VLSYSLGTHQSGGGAGVGKVKVNEFTITRTSDKASAKLLLACANGSHIKKAVLTLRKAGGVYLTYTLKDSLISAFQGGSNSHGDLKPVETISLNYTKLEVKYTSQKK